MYKLALSPSHDKVEKCLHSREILRLRSLANKRSYFIRFARKLCWLPQASFIINQVFSSRTINSNSVVATAYRNVITSRADFEIQHSMWFRHLYASYYTTHVWLLIRSNSDEKREFVSLPRGCGLHTSAVSSAIDVLLVYSISRADGASLISKKI